jgi:hypothetical protein
VLSGEGLEQLPATSDELLGFDQVTSMQRLGEGRLDRGHKCAEAASLAAATDI